MSQQGTCAACGPLDATQIQVVGGVAHCLGCGEQLEPPAKPTPLSAEEERWEELAKSSDSMALPSDLLSVSGIIRGSTRLLFQNFISLNVVILFSAVCSLIPFVNVGVPVGLTRVAGKLGAREPVGPGDILKSANYARLGEFYLLNCLIALGLAAVAAPVAYPFWLLLGQVGRRQQDEVTIAFGFATALFLIFVGLGWLLSSILLVRLDLTPLEALHRSNVLMRGSRGTVFWAIVLLLLLTTVAFGLLAFGMDHLLPGWQYGRNEGWALGLGLLSVTTAQGLGLSVFGYLYGTLSDDDGSFS